jgi:hypothetical protein
MSKPIDKFIPEGNLTLISLPELEAFSIVSDQDVEISINKWRDRPPDIKYTNILNAIIDNKEVMP